MQARLLACAACHGVHGEGTDNDYFPRLAGKPAGYLFNQLIAFRDGGRSYPPMNYLLAYLPDAYLKQMAEHFAELHPPYPAPAAPRVDAATLDLGKQLVQHGAPQRHVPACAACHGAELTGMRPAIPGLVGLHADYISAQLGAFRYGTRHTASPNCMHDISSRLVDREITAIAAWLAVQPAPADPTPAAPAPLPIACGSVPN
ncbi:c-type cytochrome [Paraburkholderia dinghuensis]|uniref:Cytochrome c4 n=1 Tax=Paraburkholderia dinghuensis TaxID=2305225 RepID=A0A3N6PLE2_9BURK|nr:c-type cytochrome [Paraburkholderia dinghuensis]RQH02240.1 cytochrome c4 [Paraburkholderia dinghuensis]